MCMTLSTLGRQSQHGFSDAVDAVEHLDHTKLFRHDRPFFVDHAVSQKSSGDDLFLSCIGQEISGDLFNKKLVVWHIEIDGFNNPVAPRPLLPLQVLFVAVRVGIASQIQPVPCPFFAKAVAV